MSEQRVSFIADGLTLAGVVQVPDHVGATERRPAFMVLHGFGSNMNAGNVLKPCALLNALGYVTLRFDMPGCGESEGEKGRLICLEQVSAVSQALTLLAQHHQVDPARIAVMGSSFGAAVAVYAGGVDQRIAAVISASGWGHGERKFRGQHPGPEAFAKFTAMLEEGRAHRARTGKSLMVPRDAIVRIPAHVRERLDRQKVEMLAANAVEIFPAETAQSMLDFRAEDVVGKIAPRPLLLIHAANDSVTPTEQSIALFERAGQPAELHLFSGVDHFLFNENSARVWNVLRGWLDTYFPARL